MWFWWFIFVCDLLIPITMIIAGNMMWKHAPKKINGIIGYRTARSMKNIDTWKFAQAHCGRLWRKIGWVILIPSVVIHFPFYHSSENIIGTVAAILCTTQCLILVLAIFPTEYALKRTFTEEGVLLLLTNMECVGGYQFNSFQFIGLIKVQNRAAVASIDNPAALSVIAPYPAFCGAVVPAVPAARYCKHSF